jgi:hypothetical protein
MSVADETFPEGWQLGCESWRFHRGFLARVGRPAAHREYSAIREQIRRRTAEALGGSFYRIQLADGTPLVVRGGWHHLQKVEHADYVPKVPKARAAKTRAAPVVIMPETPPVLPPVAQPVPPRQPLRASTLTLGNPGAARVLADRLRRFGIPEAAINQATSP